MVEQVQNLFDYYVYVVSHYDTRCAWKKYNRYSWNGSLWMCKSKIINLNSPWLTITIYLFVSSSIHSFELDSESDLSLTRPVEKYKNVTHWKIHYNHLKTYLCEMFEIVACNINLLIWCVVLAVIVCRDILLKYRIHPA